MEGQKSNLIDVDLFLHDTRERSVMVSETGLNKDVFFLPLSQIEMEQVEGTKDDRIHSITMPEWLAMEKGLI